eukprot:3784315-Pyramimonas_sp.AAC.1
MDAPGSQGLGFSWKASCVLAPGGLHCSVVEGRLVHRLSAGDVCGRRCFLCPWAPWAWSHGPRRRCHV